MIDPFHSRLDDAEVIETLGTQIRILVPAAALEGSLSIFEDRNEPGVGPPLHVHYDAEEIFNIVDGQYLFQCGTARMEASPGDCLVVPRGTPHTYLNVGTHTGRLLVTLRPGGFEDFFREVAARQLTPPDDMAAITELAARYSLEFLGDNPLAA